MRDIIKKHMIYRDWTTASAISWDLPGGPYPYGRVKAELEAMLAAGEIAFHAARMSWRLPEKGRQHARIGEIQTHQDHG